VAEVELRSRGIETLFDDERFAGSAGALQLALELVDRNDLLDSPAQDA
jgi:hypothetical protein